MKLTHYRTLGRSGLRVSPLTLGAMTFGDASWGADDTESFAILDRYLELGGNAIDTANEYTDGRSEKAIGAYLANHPGLRDRIVIGTKFSGNGFPGDPNGGGAGRKAIMHQVDGSLRRMGTDHIDLLWQHHWDRHTPLEETISALNDLVRSGKVRYIGLSDTPAWAVARMATIAEFRGWAPVVSIQVEYSLLQRTVEGELFGIARELGLGVTPWSPLASGVLSGKYTRGNAAPEGSGRNRLSGKYLSDHAYDVIELLTDIATSIDASVASVPLAWVRQRSEVTSTIIGARTVAQLDQNLASLAVTIPDERMIELDALTKPSLDFPADFLASLAINLQQGGATVNGVESVQYKRGV